MGKVQTRMTMLSALLAAAAFAIGCSGCSSREFPVPKEFAQRTELPSCGKVEHRPGSRAADLLPQSAVDCLSDARYARGGEFVLTLFTTEGDPIVHYFRVRAGSSDVEVWTDSSRDGFGGGGARWRHSTCGAPQLSSESLTGCMSAG